MAESAPHCRLMIEIVVGDAAAALAQLSAALGAASIASVIITPLPGASLQARTVQPLVALAQSKGAAALLAADAQLAGVLKADGVHVPSSPALEADFASAREILDRRAIVGGDAGRSRHDAMTLGEAGADYVAFGVPADVKEQEKARERRLDLVAWWTEIFQIPGVALDVETPDEAGELADLGCDFVGLRLAPGDSAADTRDRVAAMAAAIGAGNVAAQG